MNHVFTVTRKKPINIVNHAFTETFTARRSKKTAKDWVDVKDRKDKASRHGQTDELTDGQTHGMTDKPTVVHFFIKTMFFGPRFNV